MSYEETRDRIKDMLNMRRSNKFISDKGLFNRVVNAITEQIEGLQKDKEIKENDELKSDVASTLNHLIKIVEERPHTEFLVDFVNTYTKLVFNWNKELGNNDIENKLKYADRVINEKTTLDETLSMLRKMNDKLKNYEQYTPESLELSRHYLKTLEEDD